MADFKIAFKITMQNEGGIADNSDDAGLFTYKGITTRDWPKWNGWAAVKAAMLASKSIAGANKLLAANSQLQNMVALFYKANYWDVHLLDNLTSQSVANELFDSSVNCGNVTAAKWLQNALNKTTPGLILKVDGVVGMATIKACNASVDPNQVYRLQNEQQRDHYIALVKNNPRYQKFLKSWLSRVDLV